MILTVTLHQRREIAFPACLMSPFNLSSEAEDHQHRKTELFGAFRRSGENSYRTLLSVTEG